MKSITSPPRGCKGVLRAVPATLRTEFVSRETHEADARSVSLYYRRLTANGQYSQYSLFASSPEAAAALLSRLGYERYYDGAQGMHWRRQHSHIWLTPDGQLWPLGKTYASALAGWAVLAEHSQEVPR